MGIIFDDSLGYFLGSNLYGNSTVSMRPKNKNNIAPKPKNVYYNENKGVTVVIWEDETKTIVRAEEGKPHSPYYGYCVALAKKIHGTNSKLQRDLNNVLIIQNKEKKNKNKEK